MLTLILLKTDKTTHTYRLDDQTPQVLGRRGEMVRLLDSRVSREHAEVSVQNGIWVIRDLRSANGTWVNGQRIEGLCELEEGDRIQIGRLNLIVGHVEVDLALDDAAQHQSDHHELTDAERAAQTVVTAVTPAADQEDDEILLQVKPDETPGDLASPLLKNDQEDEDEDDLDIAGLIDDELLLEPPHPVSRTGVASPSEVDLQDNDEDDAFDALSDTPSGPMDTDDSDEEAAPRYVETAERSADDDDLADRLEFPEGPRPQRPESPLVAATERDVPEQVDDQDEDDDVAALAAEVSDGSAELDALSDAASDEGDEAPEVVGLSLDLPAPSATPATHDEPAIEREVSDDDAVVSVEDIEAMLDEDDAFEPSGNADTPAEPVQLDENATRVLYEEDEASDIASIEDEVAPEPVILAEAPPTRSAWKAVAAVLLAGAAIGGGSWWYLNQQQPVPIAGRADDPALATDTPTPDPVAVATAPSNPVPTPTPVAVDSDLDDNTRPSPTDPFGAGQQLALRTTPQQPDASASAGLKPLTPIKPTPAPLPTDTDGPDQPTAAAPKTAPPKPDDPIAPADGADDQAMATASDAMPAPAAEIAPGQAIADPADTDPAMGPTADGDAALAKNRTKPAADPASISEATAAAEAAAPASAADRRIAFLVDSSGSMVDSMDQGVMSWLSEQINRLSPNDSFTILFFHSEDVIEVPPAGLKPATGSSRDQALAWIEPNTGNVRLYGKSAPLKALEQAGQYDVNEMYILTDNKFGRLSNRVAPIDSGAFANVLDQRNVVVNTVQFFYRGDDDDNLRSIAKRFGGTYEFVKEPAFEVTDGFNLLGTR